MNPAPLYETGNLSSVTGSFLRPGGLTLTQRALEICGLPKRARVLDLGCGLGAAAAYLRGERGFQAVGLDASGLLLKKGVLAGIVIPRIRATAGRLPVLGGSLDAVVCECVLSLCNDPETVLFEINRTLKIGGYLILSDLYFRLPGLESHRWLESQPARSCLNGAVDERRIRHRVATAGFCLLVWEDHTPLLTQLAAQLVWNHGSLEAMRSAMGLKENADPGTRCSARPGYYLLVAQKKEDSPNG